MRVALAVGIPVLSFLAFKAKFWGDVMCDNPEVATAIYNRGVVSSISNVREIAFDGPHGLRTCGADALNGSRVRKLEFIINTARRGVMDPVSGITRKFEVTFTLAE